jgi:hypothetical protein
LPAVRVAANHAVALFLLVERHCQVNPRCGARCLHPALLTSSPRVLD